MKTSFIITFAIALALSGFTSAQYLPQQYAPFGNPHNSGLSKFSRSLPDSIDYNYDVSRIHPSEECNVEMDGGLKLAKVQIVDVEDSLFTVVKNGIDRDFNVSGISKMTFIKHGFWKGFLWGTLGTLAATGILFASLVGSAHGEDALGVFYLLIGGVTIAAPVGAVVGVIAELTVKDDVYGFGNVSKETKLKRLRYILSQHKE
jgi:hypothetical protein